MVNEPYLIDRGIGQQMGDLCRLAVGNAKVTQTGEIVTLEDMFGRGAFGVSVEVPYTEGGVQTVTVTRCGKNLLDATTAKVIGGGWLVICSVRVPTNTYSISSSIGLGAQGFQVAVRNRAGQVALDRYPYSAAFSYTATTSIDSLTFGFQSGGHNKNDIIRAEVQLELGSTATAYEPYNGETYTITLPADFYGGSISLEAGTVTSRYAEDGTELAEPIITEIDPIGIPILAGVNNVWSDVGTVAVSYYAADAETFRPALWYPTIYRGLTSARYLIKRASGAIASFSDAVAAPLVVLRVALPWRSEGYQSVSVTVNGTLTTITLPANFYGGYLDVVTGQLVATHDENGKALANQKLYFLAPVNISALSGVNNVWSDAGDVAVSYRIDNG